MFDRLKVWTAAAMVTGILVLTGCGGGGSSNNTQTSSSSSEAAKTLQMRSVSCLNENTLEAGRTIEIESVLENPVQDEMNVTVTYMIAPENLFDTNNSQSVGRAFAFDTFVPAPGSNTRKMSTVLPSDLESGSYRIVAMIDAEEYTNADVNLSDETAVEKYRELYAISDTLYIEANDGKPDIEMNYIAINDNSNAAGGRRAVETETTLTFDIGVMGDNVILNDKSLSFYGVFGVTSWITEAKNVDVSACIDFGTGCQPIDIFHVDDENITHYETGLVIGSIPANEEKVVMFNAVVKGTLLTEVVTAALKDETMRITLKVTVGGNGRSVSENSGKNSLETRIRLVPVILSQANIDNTYDTVSLALTNYGYTLKKYVDDMKTIDPTYNVTFDKSGNLNLFDLGDLTLSEEDPIYGLTLTDPLLLQLKDNTKLEVKPINTTTDFTLVKTVQIPEPRTNGKDPLKIEPKPDIATQLALKDGITSAILNGRVNDIAKETVNEKVYGKGFNVHFGNDYLGLDADLHGQALFDKHGTSLDGAASLIVYVFGFDYTIFYADAYAGIRPEDLKRTGYQFDVEYRGDNIYSAGKNVADEYDLENSPADEVRKRVKENITALQNYLDTHIDTEQFNIHENKRYYKSVKKSKTFMVGPIPVTVEAGVGGAIGIKESMGLKNAGSLHASCVPYGYLDAFASAGIGVEGLSAGIEGEAEIVRNDFTISFAAGLKYESDDIFVYSFMGDLSIMIINSFYPPSGDIVIYGEYPEPYLAKKCTWKACVYYPSIRTGRSTKSLCHFESDPIRKIMLNKHQKLFRVYLQ